MRARVRPRGLTSASGYNHRSERIGVPITRMRACARAMRGLLCMASARSSPRLPIVAGRARAARAYGSRQDHLLHEGEGAPRVARPVQALGATVRPAPACRRRRARSRRCRRSAAARRDARYTELAVLPAVVEWPSLKRL
jgi:hypothetical protein